MLLEVSAPMVFESHSGAWTAWSALARHQTDYANHQLVSIFSGTPLAYTAQRLSCVLHRANARTVERRVDGFVGYEPYGEPVVRDVVETFGGR
eukprot:444184-Amphidinium_carterae.1